MALAPTGEAGHWALPDLFFDSVMFGITASNPGALHATVCASPRLACSSYACHMRM
jgi:hypothetical protein